MNFKTLTEALDHFNGRMAKEIAPEDNILGRRQIVYTRTNVFVLVDADTFADCGETFHCTHWMCVK
jgi:hypothetical protein